MISELELGKLLAHVDQCNNSIDRLGKQIEVLNVRLTAMDKVMSKGKGVFAGIVFMAGGIGAILGLAWKALSGGQ